MATLGFEFWYEFGSTYSYLSAYRLEDLAHTAGVFKEQGWNDSPFNVYPAKERYMWRDMERLCAKYGVTFAKPSHFPRDGLLAIRVACLARTESEPWLAPQASWSAENYSGATTAWKTPWYSTRRIPYLTK